MASFNASSDWSRSGIGNVVEQVVRRLDQQMSSESSRPISLAIGRPRVNVDIDEVKSLRELGFTFVKIAEMLDISRRALYRAMEGAEIMGSTDISDSELDEIVSSYKLTQPDDGEVMVIGHIRSCGLRVPRTRIRDSLHRVDALGIEERSLGTIRRRVYQVDSPNSVWHIDGNHKLVRYKLVIHGCVDGFSRIIPFLKCSTNNRANTVFLLFSNAVQTYDYPLKVRTDGGGENVEIWRDVISNHNTSSVIVGSSVHNVRIERLWRDVRRSVIENYRNCFAALENESILDPENCIDLYCLHQVFVSCINKDLDAFVSSWHHHSLSTERSETPLRLSHTGSVACYSHPIAMASRNQQRLPDVISYVEVSDVSFQPCLQIVSILQLILMQNEHSEGMMVYRLISSTLGTHLLNCNLCAT